MNLVTGFPLAFPFITGSPITSKPETPAPTKVLKPTTGSLDNFCIGKKSRNYPDPTRCDGFISCNGNIAIRMICPAKLWYNAKEDECDYPENVNCEGMFLLLFLIIIYSGWIVSKTNVSIIISSVNPCSWPTDNILMIWQWRQDTWDRDRLEHSLDTKRSIEKPHTILRQTNVQENVTGQNVTRTKCHPDKMSPGQNVIRTKYHPDKISPGQNVTQTRLRVLKGEEFLASNYAVNYHIVRNTN